MLFRHGHDALGASISDEIRLPNTPSAFLSVADFDSSPHPRRPHPHLFDTIHEGIVNIEQRSLAQTQPPRQVRQVQVVQQSDGQVRQRDTLVVEAGSRTKEGRQLREEEREV